MLPFKRVTVGVDFSGGSMNALSHAVRLTRGTSAAVRAVHVVDPLVVADLSEALSRPRQQTMAEVERSARQHWERVLADGRLPGVELDIVFDSPIPGLLAAAGDLLVLGTHAEPGDAIGCGIVAAGCARRASCSVLLVHTGQTGPFRRICVGVDFSDLARDALARAAAVAGSEGAELDVVHVYAAPWHKLHYRAPTPEAAPEFMRNFAGTLERMLDHLTAGIRPAMGALAVRQHVIDAPRHGAALVAFALARGSDLIVVGAAGRRGLESLVLGTTAERVCRDASRSIMIVRPGAGAA
jgi:nucleotide-binding universal stress UspA family protein